MYNENKSYYNNCIGKTIVLDTNIDLTQKTHGYQEWFLTAPIYKSTSSGLANDATSYTASIEIDGTTYPISIIGSATQTIELVMAEINAVLVDGSGTPIGTIEIDLSRNSYLGAFVVKSISTGFQSTVNIIDTNLFSSLTNIDIGPESSVSGGMLFSGMKIKVMKPDEVEYEWDVYVDDTKPTEMRHVIEIEDIDQEGEYLIQSYLENINTGIQILGETTAINFYEIFE